jgi:hypothetical protein
MMNEELLGLYQRILFLMDRSLQESQASTDRVTKVSKQEQYLLLFELLGPYGETTYDIGTKCYVLYHYSGETIRFPYNQHKEQTRQEVHDEKP